MSRKKKEVDPAILKLMNSMREVEAEPKPQDGRIRNVAPEHSRFKPGICPNPGGQIKRKVMRQALTRLLDTASGAVFVPKTKAEEVAVSLYRAALDGDGKLQTKVFAINAIMDRMDGRSAPSDEETETMRRPQIIRIDVPRPPKALVIEAEDAEFEDQPRLLNDVSGPGTEPTD